MWYALSYTEQSDFEQAHTLASRMRIADQNMDKDTLIFIS